jgi:hypothetical protein
MKMGKSGGMVVVCVALGALALLGGCARLPPPDASNPIVKVAVLPIHNATPDMDGAEWVRTAFSQMIPTRYYTVSANADVDQILRDKMGVTLGGQLDYTNPATGAPSPLVVGQTLEVDGLVYCNLEDFQHLITGVYNKKKVKAKCRLVNAKTDAVIWEKEEEESHTEVQLSISGALDALKRKAVEGLVNSALRANPLQMETTAVIERMKSTIPSGPVVTAEK